MNQVIRMLNFQLKDKMKQLSLEPATRDLKMPVSKTSVLLTLSWLVTVSSWFLGDTRIGPIAGLAPRRE